MLMRRHSKTMRAWVMSGAVALVSLWVGGLELWSSDGRIISHGGGAMSSAQAAATEAQTLQEAFVRIGQQVGPAVVSISTEHMEQVKQYFRVYPFFGGGAEDQLDEFFRQFYGEAPDRELRRFGLGSGVIIDEQGLILTNEHVVADVDKITVTLADGREFLGMVKGKDPRLDLAVVKIDAKKLPTATLGDSSSVKTGQWAVALGNPFGLMGASPSAHAVGAEPTLTVGVISALKRQLPRTSRYDRDYSDLIQTDAAINPGNSGGPLLNLDGQVIGINVAILTSSRGFEGIGFAIPVNKAKNILEALIEGRRIVYGWLGIQIQDITEDVAEYYGLAEREGVLVYQVLSDSPASQGGMQDGDIIKAVNGQTIRHSRELIDLVSGMRSGQRVMITMLRDGKPQTLNVQIGERPSDTEVEGGVATETWRGLRVGGLSPEQVERFHVPPGTVGVLVFEVEPNSPADQSGLRAGDVIGEINRVEIENVTDYRNVVAQIKGNALLKTNRGYVVIKAGP